MCSAGFAQSCDPPGWHRDSWWQLLVTVTEGHCLQFLSPGVVRKRLKFLRVFCAHRADVLLGFNSDLGGLRAWPESPGVS